MPLGHSLASFPLVVRTLQPTDVGTAMMPVTGAHDCSGAWRRWLEGSLRTEIVWFIWEKSYRGVGKLNLGSLPASLER